MSTEKRFITATVIDVTVFGAIGCWLQISMFFKVKIWPLTYYEFSYNIFTRVTKKEILFWIIIAR